ncbi:UNVERIFIED_CONTAM: hypothetical protein Sradi_1422800 [Sesamum radiatum]|uniref:Uncharacterized protein n=1 Tax=Sesamum radiatum TaxID=300843 RepID=A0AAW2UU51_SESRA
MEDSGGRPSFRSGGGERRLEIVSGRGYYYYNGNQMYTAASRPGRPVRPRWGIIRLQQVGRVRRRRLRSPGDLVIRR